MILEKELQMSFENKMMLKIPNKTINEQFSRAVIAAFAAQLDPTIEELADVKTAVSEAVTNSIVHGYSNYDGNIEIQATIEMNKLTIMIIDEGIGIEDLQTAMKPLYTSNAENERVGMGFTIMQTFMDEVAVSSTPHVGTQVILIKKFHSRIE